MKGYWENETAEGHGHDEKLAKALLNFFLVQPKDAQYLTVLDAGCGDGYYTDYLSKDGVLVTGVDGNPFTNKFSYSDRVFGGVDLTVPQNIGSFNWVLCLEVGEHIPSEHQHKFLQNLSDWNRDGMIISWAIRGQGGDGHVNCLDNQEVITAVEPYGYVYDNVSSQILRSYCAEYPQVGWWFRNTLMVFRKKK